MPAVVRRRGTRILILAAASIPLLLAGGAALLTGLIERTCSGSAAGGDAPSQVGERDIPATLLGIYRRVGAQYKIPWEVLAGIGQEECDQGRDADPSCTPQPGSTGPGVANCAGASGPMQIGVGGGPCGDAGDAYDSLRVYLPDPSLGPHDPMTAVELAALVLIRDKGAPTGQAIDAYWPYARAYNGSGPVADAYADRVIADAHAYQGVQTDAAGQLCDGALGTPVIAGQLARILPSGEAEAPAGAPAAVQAMIAAGNRIDHFPYSYAGGHGDPAQTMSQTNPNPAAVPGDEENGGPGYDCSSATSYLLWGGGLAERLLGGGVMDSTELESVGEPGPGRWVTIYANADHAYIEVAGIYLDTAAGEGHPPNPPATGPRWTVMGTGPEGFIARHPAGL
jgi:hypothetical protein